MKLLSMSELKSVKGISFSRPHLFRLIRAKKFPKPIKLGENRNGFVETEIDAWVKQRITERDAQNPEAAEAENACPSADSVRLDVAPEKIWRESGIAHSEARE